MTDANRMTKAERSDLLSLIKKRERVMKTMASERSAVMVAEFESHAAKIYSFNDDAVWQKAQEEAAEAVKAAQDVVAERCAALGIPREFAPSLSVSWANRGENMFAWRMVELRRAAKKRIEAMEAEASLLSQGLDTDVAHAFLEAAKADMATFMPSLVVADVEKMIAPTLKRLASGYH